MLLLLHPLLLIDDPLYIRHGIQEQQNIVHNANGFLKIMGTTSRDHSVGIRADEILVLQVDSTTWVFCSCRVLVNSDVSFIDQMTLT